MKDQLIEAIVALSGVEMPYRCYSLRSDPMLKIQRSSNSEINQLRSERLALDIEYQDVLVGLLQYNGRIFVSYSSARSKPYSSVNSPLDSYASVKRWWDKLVGRPTVWTENDDILVGNSLGIGIAITDTGSLNMREGNDIISGIGSGVGCGGICNHGNIYTESGNDFIIGYSQGKAEYGILNKGLIDMGTGQDLLVGSGRIFGLHNFGHIKTQSGSDTIVGTGSLDGNQSDNLWGIKNHGRIDTGDENDRINGNGKLAGICNQALFNTDKYVLAHEQSTISMGNGDDQLTGHSELVGIDNKGRIEMGHGNNILVGDGGIVGIQNHYLISFGNGDDQLGGKSSSLQGTAFHNNYLIDTHGGNDIVVAVNGQFVNNGSIKLGEGDDIVAAHNSAGFKGTGTINLEDGNDILTGFGNGEFLGGSGTDTLLLPEGSYHIAGSVVTDNFQVMTVNGFERLGGISATTGLEANHPFVAFADGVLTVNSAGDATFQGLDLFSQIQIYNP